MKGNFNYRIIMITKIKIFKGGNKEKAIVYETYKIWEGFFLQEKAQLERNLKPSNVWALALGSIIGFGCFVLPGDWMRIAGPLGAAIGLALGGLLMMVIGNSYGFMVKTIPVAGGEFAYSYSTFGRYHAYFCGWLLSLGYFSIVPINATAIPILGQFILPDIFSQYYLYTIAGWDVHLADVVVASVAILFFGYMNYRGADVVGQFQLLMVVILVGSVFLLAGGAVISPGATFSNWQPLFAPGNSAIAGILAIVAISPWLFVGFDTIPQAAEEFNFSPKQGRNLIFLAIFFGAIMYVLVTLSTAIAHPWQELLGASPIWATGQAMTDMLGPIGLAILVAGVLMGIFTGINGFYMASSRLLFGMSRAKILPEWFSKIHPKHNTPSNAVLFVMVIALIAPWFGRAVISWIVDMCAVGTAVGYGYTAFSAYILSGKAGNEEDRKGRAFHLFGSLASLTFLVLLLVPGMPAFLSIPSWVALGVWLGLGAIFYLVKVGEYKKIPDNELDQLILGENAQAIRKNFNGKANAKISVAPKQGRTR